MPYLIRFRLLEFIDCIKRRPRYLLRQWQPRELNTLRSKRFITWLSYFRLCFPSFALKPPQKLPLKFADLHLAGTLRPHFPTTAPFIAVLSSSCRYLVRAEIKILPFCCLEQDLLKVGRHTLHRVGYCEKSISPFTLVQAQGIPREARVSSSFYARQPADAGPTCIPPYLNLERSPHPLPMHSLAEITPL